MSERAPGGRTPEMELFELADSVDPESVDGIILKAVADGITEARLDQHRLDDILDDEV